MRPLYVDLDGTLIKTDLLHEGIAQLLRSNPLLLLRLMPLALRDRALFKRRVAESTTINPATLPYASSVIETLKTASATGKPVVLATAANRAAADLVAAHVGLFNDVLASEDSRNLKGRTKLLAIQTHAGRSFDYIGNSAADLPILGAADQPFIANAPRRLLAKLQSAGKAPVELGEPPNQAGAFFRLVRPHQWVKNLLVFVPLVTSQTIFDAAAALNVIGIFVAFCLCASAGYILNDLFDIAADRIHPRKRLRPLAGGEITLPAAAALSIALVASGLALSYAISPVSSAVLLLYFLVTQSYSIYLKQYFLIDVMCLASLYTLRIIAGAVAIPVTVSHWLGAFSLFMFISLAMAKRGAELNSLHQNNRTRAVGRDYGLNDFPLLQSIGIASGFCAVLLMALYIHDDDIASRYASPELLWLACCLLLYWIGRIWMKTSRGEMQDDPIVFAARDRGSRIIILGMVALTILAFSGVKL